MYTKNRAQATILPQKRKVLGYIHSWIYHDLFKEQHLTHKKIKNIWNKHSFQFTIGRLGIPASQVTLTNQNLGSSHAGVGEPSKNQHPNSFPTPPKIPVGKLKISGAGFGLGLVDCKIAGIQKRLIQEGGITHSDGAPAWK